MLENQFIESYTTFFNKKSIVQKLKSIGQLNEIFCNQNKQKLPPILCTHLKFAGMKNAIKFKNVYGIK